MCPLLIPAAHKADCQCSACLLRAEEQAEWEKIRNTNVVREMLAKERRKGWDEARERFDPQYPYRRPF